MQKILFFRVVNFALLFILAGCATAHKSSPPAVETHPVPLTTFGSASNSAAPQQVALLLPLSGALSGSAQAIRDGFITAYNDANAQNRPAHINVIDTSNMGVQSAYQQAIAQGADFVVGPLTKSDVQTISNTVSVPTLALNYLDPGQVTPAQLYQFGLSPVDEARQTAALAWQKGARNAIIIAPAGSWGQSVATAFRAQWQALGGNVVDNLFFSGSNQAISRQIQNLLHFSQPDKSVAPTRRHDFDVIFLAASPSAGRQVRPLLKFYYAGDVPVYATSLIYSGVPRSSLDADLDGITFCDAPWALGNRVAEANLRQRVSLFWSANFQQNGRLYAVGVDSFNLMMQLKQLSASSSRNLSGATGTLYLDSQHRVVRQLACAQFRQGVPVLLYG